MKRNLAIAAGVLLAFVVGLLAGKYSAKPEVREVVKVETKTEWRERVVYRQAKNKKTTTTTTRNLDGSSTTIKVQDEHTDTVAGGESVGTAVQNATSLRLERGARPGWRASVAAAWSPGRLSLNPEVWRFGVERRLLGTVWLGAHGDTEGRFGASVALEW